MKLYTKNRSVMQNLVILYNPYYHKGLIEDRLNILIQ